LMRGYRATVNGALTKVGVGFWVSGFGPEVLACRMK